MGCSRSFGEMYSKEECELRIKQGLCRNCGLRPLLEGKRTCHICLSSAARTHAKFRTVILDYFGNCCACCGETEPLFLAIDHINNDGNIQRRQDNTGGANFYRRIAKSILAGKPPIDLQLLCCICNWGKHRNKGICPHQVGTS